MIRSLVIGLFFTLSAWGAPATRSSVLRMPLPETGKVFQTINLRTNAAYLATGTLNLSVDIPVDSKVAISPFWMSVPGGRETTVETNGVLTVNDRQRSNFQTFGVGVNCYLTGGRNSDSLVFTPFGALSYNTVHLDQLNRTWDGDYLGYQLGVMISYQWFWSNGLNLQAGIGGMKIGPTTAILAPNSGNPKDRKRVDVGLPSWLFPGLMPVINLSIGYAI
ncbi:DUF3575 domain-containing protein [bacterium]|nr:DUF3575 domain-containing protein [bacterium]